MLEEIDQSQGFLSKGSKYKINKSSFSENPSVKVTAASLLPVSAALSAISAARQAARESALPDDFPA